MVSSFSLVFENTLVQLYSRPWSGELNVVAIFGNRAIFQRAVLRWWDSPAWAANFVICVKSSDICQAMYCRGPDDSEQVDFRDMSANDPGHTELVVQGLASTLLSLGSSLPWLIHGSSGGCTTAVALTHKLLELDQNVLAVVADSGVPGVSPALPSSVPVAIFAFRNKSEYWQGGKVLQHWHQAGHVVNFEREDWRSGHARCVTRKILQECALYVQDHQRDSSCHGEPPQVEVF